MTAVGWQTCQYHVNRDSQINRNKRYLLSILADLPSLPLTPPVYMKTELDDINTPLECYSVPSN